MWTQKKIWRQWVASMLVVVLVTMAPFQSAAEQVNWIQAGNELQGDESPLDDDRDIETHQKIGTPSDVEWEQEPATPSNAKLLRTNQSYVVTFYANSELWATQDVAQGECADEPAPPVMDGYTFVGWDSDYTNVTHDRTIKAKFKKGSYQTHGVTVQDYDETWLINAQYVIHGLDAVWPEDPKRDGYTFVGWDYQRFCIKTDTIITAKYREGDLNTCKLRYQWRCPDKTSPSCTLKEELVVKGENGSPPYPEKVPGYTF